MSDRFVHLMKLGMGRNPQVDVNVTIRELIDACVYYYEKGEAIAYLSGSNVKKDAGLDETNAIYIAGLKNEANYLALLLVRGDPGRAIPGFVNPKTRKVTVLTADDPGAVRGASSHFIISKQSILGGSDGGRHRMAMEQATGISRILARDFLGMLLTRYAEQFPEKYQAEKKRTKKGEKPEVLQYRPTVRFHPEKNASLKDDMENGRIGGFKLVRGRTEFQGEAEEAIIQKMDVSLHAKIVPTADFGKVKSLVDHIQQALDKVSFEDMKLELIDEDGSPISYPGYISIDQLDDADMRYCRKLGIPGLLEVASECYDDFYEPIFDFSRRAVFNDEYWK